VEQNLLKDVINLKNVIEDFEEDHENVFMKLFVQSLIEDAAEWYRSLSDGSIFGWCNFADQLIEQFGDHNDTSFASHELPSIKKNTNESVSEFNKRFNKVLNRILRETRPVDSFLIDFYLSAFDSKTHYEIRSQRPSLPQAFKIAMRIENDRKATGIINKSDDPKLYNPKDPKKDESKEIMNMLKEIKVKQNRNERLSFHRNDRVKLQDMPYNTNWKNGKPERPNYAKDTPDPLKKVYIVDDGP